MPPIDPNQTGRPFWRSLDELADSDEFRRFLDREFADYAPEQMLDSPTRRSFMKIMGASVALAGAAGFSGCRRWPEQKVAPYTERPEGRVPGEPERYATMLDLGGVAQPLLATAYDGRPTKIEGNPTHPQSGGAAGSLAQASVLDLYDPNRSKRVVHDGQRSDWKRFEQALAHRNVQKDGGAGLAVLSEAVTSPTLADLRRRMNDQLPHSLWFEYEPVNRDHEIAGMRMAFGQAVRPVLDLEKARVIVNLDGDPLERHPASRRHARQWAQGRKPEADGGMNRLWSIDSGFTVTSANADRRLPTRASAVLDVVRALAAKLEAGLQPAGELSEKQAAFVGELADDLLAAQGHSVLVAGPDQPAEVHAAVAILNEKLGNVGKTVRYVQDPIGEDPTHTAQIRDLAESMRNGEISTLLILGGNPAYNAPADVEFAEAMKNVETAVHLAHREDETSARCTWHLPRSHYLETWGDGRAWDGTVSIQQPLILPLYPSKSPVELIALALGDERREGHDLVRRTHSDLSHKEWRRVLHDGLKPGSEYASASPQVRDEARRMINDAPADDGALELVFAEDPSVYDGRFANNGWLQELPDPQTKLTWDNAARISPTTAKELGVWQNDLVRITVGDRAMDAAVFVMPGQAPDSVGITLGYGRTHAGNVGTGVGFDAYQVRATAAMQVATGVKVRKLGRSYELVTTQNHHAIDKLGLEETHERAFGELVRSASIEHYRQHPEFARHAGPHVAQTEGPQGGHVPLQIFEEPVEYDEGHQWAMTIDLNACTGCSACVVACQAENNIPIVGKEEVANGREMHWIRVDRYFGGDPDEPDAVQQPVTCHHCENAPCEQVCPVAATVHDTEGLNVMIYNRCVGTRYCSNNCPYKVRRFNWFDWHAKPLDEGPSSATWLGMPDTQQRTVDPIRRMQFNPEVTVRMRGVMEKCTFCVQRIKAATIPAKNEYARGERDSWRVEDGAVTPACAETCPTEAIIFGDVNDPNSRVHKAFQSDRAYEMLEELNVRARTRYLARVTNPGAGHGKSGGHGGGHGGQGSGNGHGGEGGAHSSAAQPAGEHHG